MNLLARLLLSKLPSSDAPAPHTVAASAGPAAPTPYPGAAGHGETFWLQPVWWKTSELLECAANLQARPTAEFAAECLDRAAQFKAIGD